MSNSEYLALAGDCGLQTGSAHHATGITTKTITSFEYYYLNASISIVSWQVSGMSASGATQQNVLCIKF